MDNKFLMAECDRIQDVTDTAAGKHVAIPLTVAMLGEILHRAEVAKQKVRAEG